MLRSRLLELSSLTQPVYSLVNTVRYTITIYVESDHFSPPPLSKPSVLVSCGYYNKLPETWSLKKTVHIYSLTALKGRCLKPVSLGWNQGVSCRAAVLLEVLGESVPHLFQLLVTAGIPWLEVVCLQSSGPAFSNVSLHVSSSVCPISACLFYKEIAFKTHPDNQG